MPHPPQSPDLNSIELVWGKMKRLVQTYKPRNKRELKAAVEKSWKKVGLIFIRKCIRNLPERMKKVIATNGKLIS